MTPPSPSPLPELTLVAAAFGLRPWQPDDVDVALAAGLDPLISRFRYSLPRTREAAERWIEDGAADRVAGRRLELALVVGEACLGSVALADIAHGNAEIRYWLLPEGRGRGLASAAVRWLADWAFDELGLGRLVADVETDNAASTAVLERCGFRREGLRRRHFVGHDGARVDTFLYGLLPNDRDRPEAGEVTVPCEPG